MLDITRSIVCTFNPIYKSIMSDLKGCKWLDFFEELLLSSDSVGESDMKLNPQYTLDGTHLSPVYVQLMQNALVKVNL